MESYGAGNEAFATLQIEGAERAKATEALLLT